MKLSPALMLTPLCCALGCTGALSSQDVGERDDSQQPTPSVMTPGVMPNPTPGMTPGQGGGTSGGGPSPGMMPGGGMEGPKKEWASVPPTPRVVRLDSTSYDNLMATFLKGRTPDAQTPIPPISLNKEPFTWINPIDRFSTKASGYGVDANDFALIEDNARNLADRYMAQLDDKTCFGGSAKDAPCQRALIEQAGALLYRRSLETQEVDEVMNMVTDGVGVDTMDHFRLRLQALLMSPMTLFRVEVGSNNTQGTQPLSPAQLASALSFTLTSRPPDTLLYQSMEDRTVLEDTVYEGHIQRLLATSEHKARVRQFVKEYWRYGEATDVAKDVKPAEVFPSDTPGAKEAKYNPAQLIEETDRLMRDVVEESLNKDFLAQMLTTSNGYVTKDTAIFYNTTSQSKDLEQVAFDPMERQGIMMQPSWLVAFSESDHNSPIRRGLFIQETLLCGVNPEVPIEGVPALVLTKEKTLRESLGDHLEAEKSCASCHLIMDPLAFPLEQFDHFGRARQNEAGRPVVTTGNLRWSAGQFDESGEVQDPYELVERLARSEQVKRCFIQHAFEFWTGRASGKGDRRAIEEALEAYNVSGGDFDVALTSILMSDVFRKRTIKN